ncbi:MAG: caspase family protein, partial [Bacteroidota bacterium]
PRVIDDLEFSPDGRTLAACVSRGGVYFYDASSYTLVSKDEDCDDRSYNLAFSPDGQYSATVAYDGKLRLYNQQFELINTKQLEYAKPYSLAFSEDGQKIAVGYDDHWQIQVFNLRNLSLAYEPDMSGAESTDRSLCIVAFLAGRLIGGGSISRLVDGKYRRIVRIWSQNGLGDYRDISIAENTIHDLKILNNKNILFSSGRPDWGVVNLNNSDIEYVKDAGNLKLSATDRSHLRINNDGMEIGFKPIYESAYSFSLETGLTRRNSIYPSCSDRALGIEISNWEYNYDPKLNGEELSLLEENERSTSVDFSGDINSFVLGADFNLYSANTQGERIWSTPTQSTVWACNISGNDKVVVTACNDGTLRWYRMLDGELLLTLFVHNDMQRWVCWTPSGYYLASPGGEDLFGWHINQGSDKEALFYSADRFKDTYYRPDVVRLILETYDEDEALRIANERSNRSASNSSRSVVSSAPPIVTIVSPVSGSEVDQTEIELAYRIQTPNDEAVTELVVQIDGRPTGQGRGLTPNAERVWVTIPRRDCRVSLIAKNRFGSSEAASIGIKWVGRPEPFNGQIRPDLYILAIGVADYEDADFRLEYADDDARDFSALMETQEGQLYDDVVVRRLIDADATRDNILDGLDWLEQQSTEQDVAMIFFAGHGVTDNRNRFFLLPVGAELDRLRSTCISQNDIIDIASNLPSKVVVFLDACHSGRAMSAPGRRGNTDITSIINELIAAENGAVVFSSSMGSQFSLEDAAWQNGAFTEALLEGLSGAARWADQPDKISCVSLQNYITQRVRTLTDGRQATTTNYPPNVQDFPIAVVRR